MACLEKGLCMVAGGWGGQVVLWGEGLCLVLLLACGMQYSGCFGTWQLKVASSAVGWSGRGFLQRSRVPPHPGGQLVLAMFYYTWHVVGAACAARSLCAQESCRCFQHGAFSGPTRPGLRTVRPAPGTRGCPCSSTSGVDRVFVGKGAGKKGGWGVWLQAAGVVLRSGWCGWCVQEGRVRAREPWRL